MSTRRAILPILALALTFPAAARAQHGPGVDRILERARTEAGGARAWYAVRGFHEVGTEDGKPFERWVDVLRWGERVETGAAPAKLVQGYNGFGLWWLPLSTPRPPGSERELLARARSDAFFAAYAYLFTGRFDMRSTYLGARPSGGRSFDVVRIQPLGGEPRELWFDKKTGLLGRTVESRTTQPRTQEFADYRRVGRLMLPHKVTTLGDGPRPRERSLTKIEVVAPDRALFSLPP